MEVDLGRSLGLRINGLAAALGAFVALTAAGVTPAWAQSGAHPEAALRRHGSVSRLIWAPQAARFEIGGQRFSAGWALGTRGHVRTTLGATSAAALVLGTGRRSNLTLLVTGNGGATMLVWQRQE